MDWIKMRSDIYRDPRVCEMAELIAAKTPCDRNVMRNATVGALVTFWGVTRHRGRRNGDDLEFPRMKISVVDSIVELPGFADAMIAVGWIIVADESLILPRFFDGLNVDPVEAAKQKNAERQRRYRERNRNVTRDVTVTSQSNIEKSRVQKKETRTKERDKPDSAQEDWLVPSHLDSPVVRDLLTRFAEMRAKIKKPIKSIRDASAILPRFDDLDHLQFALETCIANQYQGLKPDYRPPAKKQTSSTTAEMYEAL